MGGGLTMVGNSPLILLNDLLIAANSNLPSGAATLEPLKMFAPLPIGLALIGASLAYFHFFGDKRLLTRFLESREGRCCHILGDAPANPAYRHQSYGIGLRKEDVALKEKFDTAIAKVVADGTYDRIRAKYFSFDIR